MGIDSVKHPLVTRRLIVAAVAALPLFGLSTRRGWAARPMYRFKYANNLPVTHPINIRVREILPKILQESNGKLEVRVFPNNQIGRAHV